MGKAFASSGGIKNSHSSQQRRLQILLYQRSQSRWFREPDAPVALGRLISVQGLGVKPSYLAAASSRVPRRLKSIRIGKSKYLNNRVEQDHRRIKCHIRPKLGFKSTVCADIILSGIEKMVRMMRKRQARRTSNPNPSMTEQFEVLAACVRGAVTVSSGTRRHA